MTKFGALPLRSSVDLTTCLTHEVETALSRGQTASLATLDIKGAFDNFLPGRLVSRLREQGWLANLCNWAASFATERSFCIRLYGITDEPRKIDCGLHQGSPVSPILFMLYIAPLIRLKGLKKAFGFADDFAILEKSHCLQNNVSKIGESINKALDWGNMEGVTFDPKKSELLHFSRKHKDKINRPIVQTAKFPISENTQKPYLKWLCIHFDRRLSFKHHVQIQTAKARVVAHALRCFGNTSRGITPYLSKRAKAACVLPIAYFGAEAL